MCVGVVGETECHAVPFLVNLGPEHAVMHRQRAMTGDFGMVSNTGSLATVFVTTDDEGSELRVHPTAARGLLLHRRSA